MFPCKKHALHVDCYQEYLKERKDNAKVADVDRCQWCLGQPEEEGIKEIKGKKHFIQEF